MPLIPDGYANATLSWSLAGAAKTYSSVCACGDGSFTTGDAATTALNWYNSLTGAGAPCKADQMYIGWTFDGVEILQRDHITGVMETAFHGPPIAGTAVTGSPVVESVPGYTPMVITKRTAVAGRHGRGRLYPAPSYMHVGLVDYNGTIDPTRLGVIQAQWDAFKTALSAFPRAVMVVTHVNPIPHNAEPVTSLVCRGVLGSQRRRKVRGA